MMTVLHSAAPWLLMQGRCEEEIQVRVSNQAPNKIGKRLKPCSEKSCSENPISSRSPHPLNTQNPINKHYPTRRHFADANMPLGQHAYTTSSKTCRRNPGRKTIENQTLSAPLGSFRVHSIFRPEDRLWKRGEWSLYSSDVFWRHGGDLLSFRLFLMLLDSIFFEILTTCMPRHQRRYSCLVGPAYDG